MGGPRKAADTVAALLAVVLAVAVGAVGAIAPATAVVDPTFGLTPANAPFGTPVRVTGAGCLDPATHAATGLGIYASFQNPDGVLMSGAGPEPFVVGPLPVQADGTFDDLLPAGLNLPIGTTPVGLACAKAGPSGPGTLIATSSSSITVPAPHALTLGSSTFQIGGPIHVSTFCPPAAGHVLTLVLGFQWQGHPTFTVSFPVGADGTVDADATAPTDPAVYGPAAVAGQPPASFAVLGRCTYVAPLPALVHPTDVPYFVQMRYEPTTLLLVPGTPTTTTVTPPTTVPPAPPAASPVVATPTFTG